MTLIRELAPSVSHMRRRRRIKADAAAAAVVALLPFVGVKRASAQHGTEGGREREREGGAGEMRNRTDCPLQRRGRGEGLAVAVSCPISRRIFAAGKHIHDSLDRHLPHNFWMPLQPTFFALKNRPIRRWAENDLLRNDLLFFPSPRQICLYSGTAGMILPTLPLTPHEYSKPALHPESVPSSPH